MTLDPEAFVDEVAQSIALDAPEDVRAAILSDDALQVEVSGFVQDAKDGLRAVADGTTTTQWLALRLRARKTAIVARAPTAVKTIEGLVARALEKILAEATRLERARGGA